MTREEVHRLVQGATQLGTWKDGPDKIWWAGSVLPASVEISYDQAGRVSHVERHFKDIASSPRGFPIKGAQCHIQRDTSPVVFCDAQVESGKQTNWMKAEASARKRWNYDNQPHPEAWHRKVNG